MLIQVHILRKPLKPVSNEEQLSKCPYARYIVLGGVNSGRFEGTERQVVHNLWSSPVLYMEHDVKVNIQTGGLRISSRRFQQQEHSFCCSWGWRKAEHNSGSVFHSGSFSCLHNHSRRLGRPSLMSSTATSSDGSSFFRCWMVSSLLRDGLYRKFEQLGLGWIVLSTTGWSKLRWESGSACRRPANEKSRWCPSVRGTWSLSRSVVYCTIHCISVMHCSYYLVWRQSQLHWQACYQLTSKLLTGRALWKNMKLNELLAGSTNHTAAE